ncbi:GNAT family N-acetyltransferase [Nitrincola sp. A-D6]|uniref:GNAT family N-acetyltransferase n=1 Tax=Nitrincola sp. A-D6 TaxID=1545442 RepID=UPI001F36B1BD|nr:GNAT family N-acetyltransferase [Nitrincola sp. A-D6]
MHLINCQNQQQGDAILAIFNDAILNTTALYEYLPRDRQTIDRWFADKQQLNLPVIGAVDEHGQLMGFASYGRFRPYPAFNSTVEHSIYLHPNYRGQGIGKVLLQALIERANSQQYHCMIGLSMPTIPPASPCTRHWDSRKPADCPRLATNLIAG